ncbi:MAG: DUF4403 family protein [Saprospiraceae bacterium]
MFRKYHFFVLLSVVFWASCKTTQPVRPVELYNQDNRFANQPSTIRIPVNIDIKGLERSLNNQMQGLLYEDNSFTDGDRMKVKARKNGQILLNMEGMTVSYEVPLGLWLQYNLGVGTAEATGGLSLRFKTVFSISNDWSLKTRTSLEGHNWTERPRLKVAGVSMPVESIANIMLNRSTLSIGEQIDATIEEYFKLEEYVGEAWKMLAEPFEVSEEYRTWLLINPRDVGMTPLKVVNGQMQSTIVVKSEPALRFGNKPLSGPALALPAFSYRYLNETADTGFQIFLDAVLPFDQAEKITQQNLRGQRFEQGKRVVVVDDIELYGQGNNIVVNLLMSGSYKGRIYLTGEPVFDPNRNRIEIEDLDFTLDTKNFLFKSAAWLAKGSLQKMIQENMDYLLDYNLQEAQLEMQRQLKDYEIGPGIRLNGNLTTLDIHNAYLTPEGIKVVMAIKGDLGVKVAGLSW